MQFQYGTSLIVAIASIIDVSICDSQNASVFENSNFYKKVDDYEKKICNNEPSCHLIDQVPVEWTVLPVRNCMCDSDCKIYKDCCKDSIHYNQTQQLESSKFRCHPTEKVYMVTTCPVDYLFGSIRSKCEYSLNLNQVQHPNRKLFIPVTTKRRKITYGNEYCAICNNDYSYEPWNLTLECSSAYNDTYRKNNNASANNTTMGPVSVPFVDHYANDSNEAKKLIKYNATSKSFYSMYNDQVYNCSYTRIRPESFAPYLRSCVPSAVSSCLNSDDELESICASYTSYVYNADGNMYKNVYCAQCNNVTTTLALCNAPSAIKSSEYVINFMKK